jgi:hypothetical protein
MGEYRKFSFSQYFISFYFFASYSFLHQIKKKIDLDGMICSYLIMILTLLLLLLRNVN